MCSGVKAVEGYNKDIYMICDPRVIVSKYLWLCSEMRQRISPLICHVSAQEQNHSSEDSDYLWASFLSAHSKCTMELIFSSLGTAYQQSISSYLPPIPLLRFCGLYGCNKLRGNWQEGEKKTPFHTVNAEGK